MAEFEAAGATAALRATLSQPGSSGAAVRLAARSGVLRGHTSGLAPGIAQANVVMVPAAAALDFLLFCIRNPKPCPLIEVLEAGKIEARETAPGSDVRTDVPRYRVWRYGELAEECDDILHLWPGGSSGPTTAADARDDWVTFLLGCSFSFEEALLAAGVPVRHLQQERSGGVSADGGGASLQASTPCLAVDPRNVPMYKTARPCAAAGPFAGPLVVSMRPMTPAQARTAAEVTAAFPRVHGAPIYAGDDAAAALGIADVASPDYGDRVTIHPGEVPVFWACGVTPQAALLSARLPIAITHAPGYMFVTDVKNADLAGAGSRIPGIAAQLPGNVL